MYVMNRLTLHKSYATIHSLWFSFAFQWEKPPFFDNRRDPGMQCMNSTGEANINFSTLYDVLDTKPVRNQLTTYTVLMDVANDRFEVYLQ